MASSSSLRSLRAIVLITVVCATRSIFPTVDAFSSPRAHHSSIGVASTSRLPSQRTTPPTVPSSSSSSSLAATHQRNTSEPTDDNDNFTPASARRRQCMTSSLTIPLIASSTFWGGVGIFPSASHASDEPPSPSSDARLFLEGVATLKSGTDFKPSSSSSSSEDTTSDNAASSASSAALYVTAKPESLNNAPKTLYDALVGRYGGKSPPVLTARFPITTDDDDDDDANAAFPFRFRLTAADLTEEGAYGGSNSSSSSDEQQQQKYWWEGENLIISARLDSDGVAATRDPGDLVGRSLAKGGGGLSYEDIVSIELQGRGLFGKSVTKRK